MDGRTDGRTDSRRGADGIAAVVVVRALDADPRGIQRGAGRSVPLALSIPSAPERTGHRRTSRRLSRPLARSLVRFLLTRCACAPIDSSGSRRNTGRSASPPPPAHRTSWTGHYPRSNVLGRRSASSRESAAFLPDRVRAEASSEFSRKDGGGRLRSTCGLNVGPSVDELIASR